MRSVSRVDFRRFHYLTLVPFRSRLVTSLGRHFTMRASWRACTWARQWQSLRRGKAQIVPFRTNVSSVLGRPGAWASWRACGLEANLGITRIGSGNVSAP